MGQLDGVRGLGGPLLRLGLVVGLGPQQVAVGARLDVAPRVSPVAKGDGVSRETFLRLSPAAGGGRRRPPRVNWGKRVP